MGCVTSKMMTKTSSFREEVNRSLRRKHNIEFPDLFFISSSSNGRNGSDHLLWSSVVDDKGGIDKQEAQLKEEEEIHDDVAAKKEHFHCEQKYQFSASAAEESSDISSRRSKSFHLSSSSTSSITGAQTTDPENTIGSKSFHTLDEYDAMLVERSRWLTTTEAKRNWEDKLEVEDYLQVSNGCQTAEENDSSVVGSASNAEKGALRKARAKHLTSLEIPSAIEFPIVGANVNGKAVQQCDYYVTPKFGSSGLPVFHNNKDTRGIDKEAGEEELYAFDPEMICSLELSMKQFQVEEEFLLKQMMEHEKNCHDDSRTA